MSRFTTTFILAALVVVSTAPGEIVTSLSIQEIQKPALAALQAQKKQLIDMERLAAESEHGKEKAQTYLKYFEDGLSSETGSILIEGHENHWLEIAFWRGYSFRAAYVSGYLSGKSENGN